MKKNSIICVEEIVSVLTDKQKQLLKDTIIHGGWGDCDQGFLDEDGNIIEANCFGYITNDAHLGGHFANRRSISVTFRNIYKKMCNEKGIGKVISHISDWWGDGSGDVLFVKDEYIRPFEEWARK